MASDPTKDAVIGRHVLWSTFSNYLGQFVTIGVGIFLTPFLLHRLGATAYGLWILVNSLAGYSSLLDFGIASAVTKYIAEYRARGQIEQAQSLVATALYLYVGLGLIAILLSAVLAPLFPHLFKIPPEQQTTAVWLVLLVGLGIGISIPCATSVAFLRGLQRFDLINLISVVGTLLYALATVIILLAGGGIIGIMLASISITLLMQVPSVWLIHRIAPEFTFRWRSANRQLVRMVASFSSSLFVINLATQLQSKTDELVIGAFLPISVVTPYALARKFSEIPQILTQQFVKVLLPLASTLDATQEQGRLRTLYIISTRLSLVAFVPIACTLVMLARPLLTLWVGAAYADTARLAFILTLASLIDVSQWPASFVLQGMARHRPLARIAIGSGLANLGLSIILVQSFGVMGVALGTLIPVMAESLFFIMPYVLHVIGVSLREALVAIFWPALAPALPMLAVLYLLRRAIDPVSLFSIAGIAAFGLLVYLAGYLAIGASAFERQTYRELAVSATRFARMHCQALAKARDI